MSIVFFGTGAFAVPSLRAARGQIALVVTQPDRPSGRGMRMQSSPVAKAAVEMGLQVAKPERSREPSFLANIGELCPSILLVASYGQILPVGLLEMAAHGGINIHGSILPKYRGAAPIQRALLNGDSETGVTLMRMAKGMDTGDIIDIVKTQIGSDETYGELQDRLAGIGSDLTMRWLPALEAGKFEATPQDNASATIAPKIEREEGELNFHRNALSEYARFRAATPNPGAYFVTRFGRVRLSVAHLSTQVAVPGTVLSPNLVAFNGGSLELLEVQPEGKRRMSGRDFFNGARLRHGDSLISHAT